ncbi:hypothetical protein O9993_14805 [Vibrio lentus]|nr:hypothetical protein [Vibrio lentus]
MVAHHDEKQNSSCGLRSIEIAMAQRHVSELAWYWSATASIERPA